MFWGLRLTYWLIKYKFIFKITFLLEEKVWTILSQSLPKSIVSIGGLRFRLRGLTIQLTNHEKR